MQSNQNTGNDLLLKLQQLKVQNRPISTHRKNAATSHCRIHLVVMHWYYETDGKTFFFFPFPEEEGLEAV